MKCSRSRSWYRFMLVFSVILDPVRPWYAEVTKGNIGYINLWMFMRVGRTPVSAGHRQNTVKVTTTNQGGDSHPGHENSQSVSTVTLMWVSERSLYCRLVRRASLAEKPKKMSRKVHV